MPFGFLKRHLFSTKLLTAERLQPGWQLTPKQTSMLNSCGTWLFLLLYLEENPFVSAAPYWIMFLVWCRCENSFVFIVCCFHFELLDFCPSQVSLWLKMSWLYWCSWNLKESYVLLTFSCTIRFKLYIPYFLSNYFCEAFWKKIGLSLLSWAYLSFLWKNYGLLKYVHLV